MKKAIAIIAILVVAGLGGFKAYQYNHPEKFPEPVKMAEATSQPITQSTQPALLPSTPTITIHSTPPINGTLKGVIEVGASGFNAFVVSIDKTKNWEMISKQFGKSLAYEGFATTDDVKAGLKNYLSDIFEKGVNGRNMHFVMSSGALKNPKTELIAKAIESDGYIVNRVTAEQEGKYALRSLLSRDYMANSFTVDIGSGNTKISWYEGSTLHSVEAPGAKYYQNNISDAQAFTDVVAAVSKVPEANRLNCFVIGGVPHTLAEQSHSGNERYTQLEAPDWYSAGDDVKMKSGLNIYKALRHGSGCDNYIFDWDANFTIGFLLTLN